MDFTIFNSNSALSCIFWNYNYTWNFLHRAVSYPRALTYGPSATQAVHAGRSTWTKRPAGQLMSADVSVRASGLAEHVLDAGARARGRSGVQREQQAAAAMLVAERTKRSPDAMAVTTGADDDGDAQRRGRYRAGGRGRSGPCDELAHQECKEEVGEAWRGRQRPIRRRGRRPASEGTSSIRSVGGFPAWHLRQGGRGEHGGAFCQLRSAWRGSRRWQRTRQPLHRWSSSGGRTGERGAGKGASEWGEGERASSWASLSMRRGQVARRMCGKDARAAWRQWRCGSVATGRKRTIFLQKTLWPLFPPFLILKPAGC